MKKRKKRSRPARRWPVLGVLALCLALLAACALPRIPWLERNEKSAGKAVPSDMVSARPEEEEEPDPSPNAREDEAEDSDAYYEERAEIVAVYDAESAEEVKTESQAQDLLTDRGFGDEPIETEYSMGGAYSSPEEISGASEEKHPLYETYYFNQSGEVWLVYLINGCLVANPLSYNAQPGLDRLVLISESEVVTSYDNYTNQFYDTIPDPDVMTVILVDTIDAATLDMLTVEVIGRL